MIRHLTEWFKDTTGLAITIGIITIMAVVFLSAKQFSFTSNRNISDSNEEIGELTIDRYDGIKVSGSEVINAIKRYQSSIPVTINNGTATVSYTGTFKASENKRGKNYISPRQVYGGYVVREKGAVTGLKFVEESQIVYDKSDKEELGDITGLNPENTTIEELLEAARRLITEKRNTLNVLDQKIKEQENSKLILNDRIVDVNTINATLTSEKEGLENQLKGLQNTFSIIQGKYNRLLTALAAKGVNINGSVDDIIRSINEKGFKLKPK